MRMLRNYRHLQLKLILAVSFVGVVVLFLLRSNFRTDPTTINCSSACVGIPPFVSQALLHYSTLAVTPQQTIEEISIAASVLKKKAPCYFLVFGLGHDSLMWSALNYGGRTVFLEEDENWVGEIRNQFPSIESYRVVYDTKVNQADYLMEVGKREECIVITDPIYSMCQLVLEGLPKEVYEIKWDLIMVDAPTGYRADAPGRMKAIYTTGMMARNKPEGETDIFVHDVNREVEDKFTMEFLCEGYMTKQEGRMRHFTIPSHKDANIERSFCP